MLFYKVKYNNEFRSMDYVLNSPSSVGLRLFETAVGIRDDFLLSTASSNFNLFEQYDYCLSKFRRNICLINSNLSDFASPIILPSTGGCRNTSEGL